MSSLQKLLTFFQQKFLHICVSLDVNFNDSLTTDIVSFEQLGPAVLDTSTGSGMNLHRFKDEYGKDMDMI